MRRSTYIHLLVFGGVALLPFVAHAASTGIFVPIISPECTCAGGQGITYSGPNGASSPVSAPDWGCVLQTFQNLVNLLIPLATVLITLFIAYSGFTMIASPTNAENRTKARTGLLNAVLGLLIVLCAWLLVDAVMKALYNPNAGFGPWNSILAENENSKCLTPQKPGKLPELTGSTNPNGGTGPVGIGTNPSPNTRGDCTPSGLTSDGMSSSIASTMSCITKTEDASCSLGAKSTTDIGTDGRSVSIGMFQINISANNLSQYPACEAAVNNQPLNCTQAFAGGAYTPSNHNTHVSSLGLGLYSLCVQAASNAKCNVQAAQDIYVNHGGSKNWGTAARANCG